MEHINNLPAYLYLGNYQDFGHEVKVDLSAWNIYALDRYEIRYVRAGETQPHPIAGEYFSVVDGILTWTISQTVTDKVGRGSIVFEGYVGNFMAVHSNPCYTAVGPGLPADEDAPTPVQDWITATTATEAGRVAAETSREIAEGLREDAEEDRVAAEGLRVGAETARGTAEGLRVAAETARETAEGLRDSAETAREEAEALRVAAEAARMGFAPKGAYNAATEYKYGDWVTHEGGSYGYINATPSTGTAVSVTSHWQQIASIGGQDLVDAAVAARDAAQGYKDAAANSAAQLAAGTASPSGTYANLAALISADPDHGKIYITLDDGNWCYHNGSTFVAGGMYQATGIADGSVTPIMTSFLTVPKNLFNKATVVNDKFLDVTNGGEIVSVGWHYSDYIPVMPNTTYTGTEAGFLCYYTSEKVYISGKDGAMNTITTPANAYFMRVSVGDGIDTAQVEAGSSATSYAPYAPYGYYFDAYIHLDGRTIENQSIPVDKLDFITVSKNLLNKATVVNDKYLDDSSGDEIVSVGWHYSDYIPVMPNTAYTGTDAAFVCYYTSEKVYISGKAGAMNTITTPANAYFMRVSVGEALDTAQVEAGSSATSYAPYGYYFDANIIHEHEAALDPIVTTEKIVKVGGTIGVDCDYTKLTDGLAAAYAMQNATVRVLAGTYDIVSELGTLAGNGPVVGNGMHLIFSPRAFVTCHYTGGNAGIEQDFAPINAGNGDFIIEGMNLSASCTRYCVHDELAGAAGFRRHEFRNCTMYLDNRLSNWSAAYTACIGAGLGAECQIIIDGGYYKSETPGHETTRWGRTISYHNGNSASALSEIIVKNVYFDGADAGLSFGSHGPSTAKTKCYVSNCSYLSAPSPTPDTPVNMEIIAFNNEIRTP